MTKPPFNLTPEILSLVASIQGILGELQGLSKDVKPSVKLRKENKIRTIHHSLAIEGNTLTEDQITALIEKQRVIGPQQQILEVRNAIELYDQLSKLTSSSEKDFLKAHRILMQDLITKAGKYRTTAVGILKGSSVARMAPPARQVPRLMGDLFDFLKHERVTHPLIKACVFHYELEFIHPFTDGNGRMGRLWQQAILMRHSPVFGYLAVESWVHRKQNHYYKALEKSDRDGHSTGFIEFSLRLILKELQSFHSQYKPQKPSASDRIVQALEYFDLKLFSRKEYQALHKGISAPTASRDLAQGVEEKKLSIQGTKATAIYKVRYSK